VTVWNERRYSPWLLKHEELLRHKQMRAQRVLVLVGLAIAATEAALPWSSITPAIPYYIHIAVAAIALPVLYLAWQGDLKRKEQAFATALSDKGRRLLFLDPYLEPEEFALSEQLAGVHVLPLQRQIDTTLQTGASASLHRRMEQYFRILPSAVHEGDRLGLLSFLHPVNFFIWVVVLAVCWVCTPGVGFSFGSGSGGLTVLPLLAAVYLYATRLNTRFGYEAALFDWLRMG
jgi:hypothetical protein